MSKRIHGKRQLNLSLLCCLIFVGNSSAALKPTNLLFVMTDQQSFDMIGSVNPQVKTPVLDALAKQGIRFDHAISNSPLCTPYRSMLMSGQHPLYNGCFRNDVPLLPDTTNRFAHVLGRAGYETAYVGKWHLYGGGTRNTGIPKGPNRQGFDEIFLSNNCTLDFRPDACYYWDDDNNKHFFKDVYPDKPWELEAQTRQAVEWFGQRNRDKPFALFVSWHPPHNYGGDGRDDMPGQQINYNVDVLDPDLLKPYEGQAIRLRPGTPVQESMRECSEKQYRNYMAMVTACDSALGRLIAQLKKQGVYDNTLIVFTSDHGDMLGSHGAQKPKTVPQDYSLRIPLVMHWTDRLPKGRTSDLLIGAMDIMPTVLGLLGLPIPASVQGADLSQAIRTGDDAAVKSLPIFMYPGPAAWRGVYTPEWTYARSVGSATESYGVPINVLYNHKKDPAQLHNLFDHPDHAEIQAKLEAQTQAWMQRYGDRNYTMEDFEKAAKQAGLPSWINNYEHRPVDILSRLEVVR